MALSREDVLSPESDGLIPKILELAALLDLDNLAAPSRARLVQQIWQGQGHSRTLSALRFGLKIGEWSIVGAAYYAIMCRGYEIWNDDPTLLEVEKRTLTHGMTCCARKWEVIMKEWMESPPCCGKSACDVFLRELNIMAWYQCMTPVPWCDIVGKLQSVQRSRYGYPCAVALRLDAKEKELAIRENIIELFLPDPPVY